MPSTTRAHLDPEPSLSRQPHSRSSSPRPRAAQSWLLDVMVLRPSVPLAGPRGREEGENPRAVDQIEARSPGRWGDAVEAPALQSKPVAPASRLVARVAPSVAFGLRLRILAAGPARNSHYSYRERLCDRSPQSCRNAIEERARGDVSATPTPRDRRSGDQPDNAPLTCDPASMRRCDRRGCAGLLDRLDVDGLGTLVPGLSLVGDLRALGERAIALADDR